MKIMEIYKKNPTNFFVYLLLGIAAFVMGGVVLFPSVFYDLWIWKYYWGPVVADASGEVAVHNGIEAFEGYTMVSEITYGIILIIALYAIYKLLKRLKITVDWKFALALMPFILFGPVTRTLEDTGYFDEPTVYWFISPLIYFQIAVFAIFFLLLGYYLEKKYKKPRVNVNSVIFVGGLFFLIPSLYPIVLWILGDKWGDTAGVRFDVILIVLGLIFLIVGLVYLVAYIYRNKEKFAVYKNPLNLAMLSGHLIDGITSYISIKDPFSMGLQYAEKHPASNVLLEIWGPLFPITKFILIIVVIYVFDVLYKDELKNHLNLVNLLKIGILILGFSPGLRDLLRVTMGVYIMRRHPDWLKVKIGGGEEYVRMKSLLRNSKLHTICEEAKCPNIAECFGSGTAVFLILGDICTRNCKYCNVKHGTPMTLNLSEPDDVAQSVKELDLKYVVITSVTRDDLDDGGASVFSDTVNEIKKSNQNCKVEVLIPDFKGKIEPLKEIVNSNPDVINHNIEVVRELFPEIRPEGNYETSLKLLSNIKDINKVIKTKSGFMIGIGENKDQILSTMKDLRNAEVDFLTIGQYLQPTKNHAKISKYYTPEDFDELKKIAYDLGFEHVESGPLVRSSYHAQEAFC